MLRLGFDSRRVIFFLGIELVRFIPLNLSEPSVLSRSVAGIHRVRDRLQLLFSFLLSLLVGRTALLENFSPFGITKNGGFRESLAMLIRFTGSSQTATRVIPSVSSLAIAFQVNRIVRSTSSHPPYSTVSVRRPTANEAGRATCPAWALSCLCYGLGTRLAPVNIRPGLRYCFQR